MSFADHATEYTDVKTANGSVVGSVRPMNDVDFSLLWQKHAEAMELVVSQFFAARLEGGDLDFGSLISGAVRNVPDLITDVICVASDEHLADWDKVFASVSRMSIGLRIECLNTILRITSEAEGGLAKVLFLINASRPKAADAS
ncbi:phage pre-tape measure protein [Paenirhodobacter populi]|uniref:Uncharacterized protein n=1 Tax=Paenirhodobacter populi TaxID=2306993 RepID=A0A443J072_9RHOB|nr:hypothetical protein [Sinirhodobacter populi]RWR13827.1 hypothetical protein D2T33_05360 [Sinirhodobacter populi]